MKLFVAIIFCFCCLALNKVHTSFRILNLLRQSPNLYSLSFISATVLFLRTGIYLLSWRMMSFSSTLNLIWQFTPICVIYTNTQVALQKERAQLRADQMTGIWAQLHNRTHQFLRLNAFIFFCREALLCICKQCESDCSWIQLFILKEQMQYHSTAVQGF